MNNYTGKCENCGKDTVFGNRFCNKTCSGAAYRRKNVEKRREYIRQYNKEHPRGTVYTRVCVCGCGRSFQTTKPTRNKYEQSCRNRMKGKCRACGIPLEKAKYCPDCYRLRVAELDKKHHPRKQTGEIRTCKCGCGHTFVNEGRKTNLYAPTCPNHERLVKEAERAYGAARRARDRAARQAAPPKPAPAAKQAPAFISRARPAKVPAEVLRIEAIVLAASLPGYNPRRPEKFIQQALLELSA